MEENGLVWDKNIYILSENTTCTQIERADPDSAQFISLKRKKGHIQSGTGGYGGKGICWFLCLGSFQARDILFISLALVPRTKKQCVRWRDQFQDLKRYSQMILKMTLFLFSVSSLQDLHISLPDLFQIHELFFTICCYMHIYIHYTICIYTYTPIYMNISCSVCIFSGLTTAIRLPIIVLFW